MRKTPSGRTPAHPNIQSNAPKTAEGFKIIGALTGRFSASSADLSGIEGRIKCPKCGAAGGDDWSQCRGDCPMPASPHFGGSKGA